MALLAWYLRAISEFEASSIAYYLLNIPLALGLCLLWGYCGILSFGQVAYFGIAGYLYGIIAGNLVGNVWSAARSAAWSPARWWRRSSATSSSTPGCRCGSPPSSPSSSPAARDVLGQTAGYQWRVGNVQLGGYNGMTGIPSFQLGDLVFFGYPFYYYVVVVVLLCFVGCGCWSAPTKVMLAIREDALRTELLGYDIRWRQLATFVLAAVRRDLRPAVRPVGQLHHPTQVGLLQASLPVIWVAVGGRDSLVAVALSTYALNWLNYSLSSAGNQYAPSSSACSWSS